MSQGFCQGWTLRREASRDTAERAFSSSTVTSTVCGMTRQGKRRSDGRGGDERKTGKEMRGRERRRAMGGEIRRGCYEYNGWGML